MSLPLNHFAQHISVPMNTFKYFVHIVNRYDPMSGAFAFLAHSTRFPTVKLANFTLAFQGEKIQYPSIIEDQHSWNFSIAEDESGLVSRNLDRLSGRGSYDEFLGIFKLGTGTHRFFDVEIIPLTLQNAPAGFKVTLQNAWLSGKDDVQLSGDNNSSNWDWTYNFIYNGIIETENIAFSALAREVDKWARMLV